MKLPSPQLHPSMPSMEASGSAPDQPLAQGQVVTGAIFSEPMRVETVHSNGSEIWEVGLSGLQTERFRRVTLTLDEIKHL